MTVRGASRRLQESARQAFVVLAALAALVACGPGEDAARDGTGTSALDYNEADVVFARTMIPHGEQGASMSELVLEQKGLKPTVQALAEELRGNRATETDQLQQWIAERGEPVAAEAKHDHGGGEDGIATPTQMHELDEATGSAAQTLYVEMMTKHHRGAVAAAHEEIEHGKNPVLIDFAQMVLRTREEQLAVLLDTAAQPVTSASPAEDEGTR